MGALEGPGRAGPRGARFAWGCLLQASLCPLWPLILRFEVTFCRRNQTHVVHLGIGKGDLGCDIPISKVVS